MEINENQHLQVTRMIDIFFLMARFLAPYSRHHDVLISKEEQIWITKNLGEMKLAQVGDNSLFIFIHCKVDL